MPPTSVVGTRFEDWTDVRETPRFPSLYTSRRSLDYRFFEVQLAIRSNALFRFSSELATLKRK